MSAARECDLCGKLFKDSEGCLGMDVRVYREDNENYDTWDGVDLCKRCADKVLKTLRPALLGIDGERVVIP